MIKQKLAIKAIELMNGTKYLYSIQRSHIEQTIKNHHYPDADILDIKQSVNRAVEIYFNEYEDIY